MLNPAPALSLYLHFPWCVRKCPYCDFNSHTLRSELPEADYVSALLRDLDFELGSEPALRRRPLLSIFMGGGTPSLFSGAAIARLLDAVAARMSLSAHLEVTLEANPGTADAAHFRDYRSAGVNRLSLGLQSLCDDKLRALGRIHGRAEALRALAWARDAGFDNLNCDLMFALPQQSAEQAEADLVTLLRLAPEHISYYQLTLEPNTAFAAAPPPLPDGDLAWRMQVRAQALLAEAGYEAYEVSAYARRGHQARHNLNYWRYGDYLGIGAGAHGKLTLGDPSRIRRRARHKSPRPYLSAAGTAAALQSEQEVAPHERPFEFMLNALRLREGFSPAQFEAATGLGLATVAAPLARAERLGLLEREASRIRPSARGRDHLNDLVALFLPDA